MRRYPFGQLLALMVLTLLAGASFVAVFRPIDLLLALTMAAVVPVLLSIVCRAKPRPHLVWVTLANTLAAVVFLGPVVFRDSVVAQVIPTGATLIAISDATRNGWAEILSSTTPVPGTPSALFVPVALTWLAGFVGTEMTFRTRRVFLVMVPAVAVGIAGILFSDHASGTWRVGAFAFVIVAAIVVATRASAFTADSLPFDQRAEVRHASPDYEGDESQRSVARALLWHRLAMAIPFIAIITAVAVPLAGSLPFVKPESQVVFRDHYDIPIEERSRVNPMSQIAGAASRGDVRFAVKFDQQLGRGALSGPPKLRTAVLDTFDGAQWTSTGTYVTTGGSLPPTDSVANRTRNVTQTILVVKPESPWLPALPQPVSVDAPTAATVQVDPLTGALLASTPQGSGFTYQVKSQVADITAADFQIAGAATGESARVATSTLKQLPKSLVEIQDLTVKGTTTQAQQLSRLLTFFRNGKLNEGPKFAVDPEAPVGFALGNLDAFVDATKSRKGRPEEFAAAFATIAKSIGFPTRIVIGYNLPDTVAPNASIEVKAEDQTAWPEVQLQGLGWVAFDPLPTEADTTQLALEEQKLDAAINESVATSSNNPEQPPGTNPNLQPPSQISGGDDESQRTQVLIVCLIAGGILVALILAPWVRKRRRRARRRNALNAAVRAEGAWQEALDRLVEAGSVSPENLTTREVAVTAADHFGAEAELKVSEIGVLVNQALHDRQEPSHILADEMWVLTDDFDSTIRRQRGRRERMRAALDRRPLVGSRGDR